MKDNGKLCVIKNGSGIPCYYFRWWEFPPQPAEPVRRKREVGRVDSMTIEQAEETVKPWRLAANAHRPGPHNVQTMGELIAHFRMMEMPEEGAPVEDRTEDAGENERAWSTKDRYDSILTAWIEPQWSKVPLESIVAGEVEKWLRGLKRKPCGKQNRGNDDRSGLKPLAPGTKAKIRNLMSVLFNHAIRWRIFSQNPISGPARKAGVRQSSKRQETPDILELDEMRGILAELSIREKALISLDMITGIRRGELAGLKWEDIDFDDLLVNVVRSVVDQRTGKCKTEASAKPVPIDADTAEDLLAWYRVTPYNKSGDWVFATDSARAGEKRGKQPLWLSKVMQYHIQPLVKSLGINKRVSWHTFRRTFTSLLTANNENVKVVQDLLRHASSKVTLDVYAQARMEDKRRAQQRIVKRLRIPATKSSRDKTASRVSARRPKAVSIAATCPGSFRRQQP
jgi:integrase